MMGTKGRLSTRLLSAAKLGKNQHEGPRNAAITEPVQQGVSDCWPTHSTALTLARKGSWAAERAIA